MHPLVRRLGVVLGVAGLAVPVGSAAAGTTDRGPVVPVIAWGSCGAEPALAKFQCASVEVPTDYDQPRGATTTIALTRLPASKPAERIGTLFTNPGGPGGAGLPFVQQFATTTYSADVRAKFDILGFDPRGVGKSDPVTCFPTAAEEAAAMTGLPQFPMTRDEIRQTNRINAKLGLGCLKTSPDRLKHFSTANVARDMDLLRQAVGDKKLTYIGYSYGTYLGATYAELFPHNIRALALDGTWTPSSYAGSSADSRPLGVRLGQAKAASEVFAQFKAECKQAGPSQCALAALGDPGTAAEQTLERLKTHPVDVTLPDGSKLTITYALTVGMIFSQLYSPAAWPNLALALTDLAVPRRTATKTLGKASATVFGWNQREEDYASLGTALQPCVEAQQTGRPFAYQAMADAADKKYPHFGRLRTWTGQACEFIPVRDTDAVRGPWTKLKADAPVLVIGTRHDPATPYAATRPYADLYPDAHLLTVNGWGHTTIGKSACADAAITRYLVTLDRPADGASCAQNRRPFDPPGR
ncbi:alpha/beta hydrolase [Kribbella sp. DT2]|uniref:alpha/beta hydrolase n=1 Tax=Kribbella sp. DT2 TaxID=3393427 RepID=UPI003CE81D3E